MLKKYISVLLIFALISAFVVSAPSYAATDITNGYAAQASTEDTREPETEALPTEPPTEAPPTEPATEIPEPATEIYHSDIYINANGEIYEVYPGSTITYTFYLKYGYYDDMVCSLDAATTFDSSVLSLVGEPEFPQLGEEVILGDLTDGRLKYNYSDPYGARFKFDDSVLLKAKFHVAEDAVPDTYSIYTHIVTLAGSDELKCIANGVWIEPDLVDTYAKITGGDYLCHEEAVTYAVESQTYVQNSYESTAFTFDERTCDRFRALYIDGSLVPYWAFEYRLITDYYYGYGYGMQLTLKPEYLESLVNGEHQVRLDFDNGQAYTSLYVILAGTTDPTEYATECPTDPSPYYPAYNGTVYFDAASAGWNHAESISFYIWEIDGSELIPWGSKKLKGTYRGNGIWGYDTALQPNKQYGIIFINDSTLAQTYDLLMDTTCFGDTARATGAMVELPYDSNKTCSEVRWTNSALGPRLQITSIGNIVGEMLPDNTTPYQMFVHFLSDYLNNALIYSNKNVQTLIDDTAGRLGLTQEDVVLAISDTYAPRASEWSAAHSSLPSDNPIYTTGYYSFYLYLTETLPVLRTTSIKPDQYLVDDEARDRGLKMADVKYVIDKYNIRDIEWEEEYCKLESGYSYQEDSFYLYSTDTNSEYGFDNIPGYYQFNFDRTGGYYTLNVQQVDIDSGLDRNNPLHHVAVAQYHNGSFIKVSGDLISASPKLYFFRPEELGYCFGYNTAAELPEENGNSSSSGSSSSSTYPLPNPEIKKIESVVDGLKITWGAVSGAEKYRLYVRVYDGWDRIVETTDTTYIYNNVTSGNACNFTVRCVSADGSQFTSDYDRSGRSGRYLAPPQITSLKSTDNGVEIKWDPVPGNAKYRVYVQYLDMWKALGDTYDTSFIHSSQGEGSIFAHAGTSYTYTVRCLSYNGKVLTSGFRSDGRMITYQPLKYVLGDANGDGEVDLTDAAFIQRYCTDIDTGIDEAILIHGDVDDSGELELTDATFIQRFATGLSVPFTIGELIK